MTRKPLQNALAGTALLAGCGETETRNDYVDTVNEAQTNVFGAFEDVVQATPKNDQELIQGLASAEAVAADAVEDLESVDVPEDAEAGHPKLVSGFEKLRNLFAETADEVEKADANTVFSAVTSLANKGAAIGEEIDQAIAEINQDLGAD